MLAEDTNSLTMCSLEELITNKWKVDYDDISLDCRAHPQELADDLALDAATVEVPQEVTAANGGGFSPLLLARKEIMAAEDATGKATDAAATAKDATATPPGGAEARQLSLAVNRELDQDEEQEEDEDGSLSPISNDGSSNDSSSSSCEDDDAVDSCDSECDSDSKQQQQQQEKQQQQQLVHIAEYSNNNNKTTKDGMKGVGAMKSMQDNDAADDQAMEFEMLHSMQVKSRSVPPTASPTMDCLDCPAVPVPWRNPCACPRKRKEPQDEYYEHERKWSRSSSLREAHEAPRILASHVALKNQQKSNNGGMAAMLSQPPQNTSTPLKIHAKVEIDSGFESRQRAPVARRPRSSRRSSSSNSTKECDRTDASNGSIKDGAKNKRPDPSPPNLPPPPVSPVAIEPEPVVKNAPKETVGCWVSNQLAHILGSTQQQQQQPQQQQQQDSNGHNDHQDAPTQSYINSTLLPHMDAESSPRTFEATTSPRTSYAESPSPRTSMMNCHTPRASYMNAHSPRESFTNAQSPRTSFLETYMESSASFVVESQSPRKTFLATTGDSNRFVDINTQRGTSSAGSKVDRSRVKLISRQLADIKKELELLEINFREEFGYRPSKQDKLNSQRMSSIIDRQTRLKRELKHEKELAAFPLTSSTAAASSSSKTTRCIEAIRAKVDEITRKMETNRTNKKRPFDLQTLNLDQILEEKMELQSLLKDYEREFGHPDSREEKEVTKDIYQRYRSVKRLARRSSQIQSGEITDMPAIPEDVIAEMTLATPGHRITFHLPSKHSSGEKVSKHDMDLPSFIHNQDSADQDDDLDTTWDWHTLSRMELVGIARSVREDKKVARHAIKEFEKRFKNITGRKVTKEDREPLDHTYRVYKNSKAKLKLINALLSKQNRH